MPKNKKEEMILTLCMCSLMVLGMSIYNLVLHHDFSVMNLIKGYIPGFITALLLDVLIVGKIAPMLAFKLPFAKKSPLHGILTISTLMVLFMVSFMSVFGIIMETHSLNNFGSVYLQTWGLNFIMALPLQLLIVGPISRKVLATVASNN